jgi:hypothetical protein
MTLAEVEEKLGDWDSAYGTWDSLCKLTQESRVRELAQASLQRVNDERVISRLVQGEQAAQTGDYATALHLLLDAASLKPSARTFDRVRNRYFELLGRWFSEGVSTAKTTHGWKSIAVANFVGGSDVEGYSIRDRIYSALATSGMDSPKIIFLSEQGTAALQKGSVNLLAEPDKRAIYQAGVDAVVFGTLDGRLRGYTYDVREEQTRPLLAVQPFSAIPGFPSNVEAWTRLPTKSDTSRGLRIEVWTERASYAIDDEVVFHIRSNKDCYVTLLDLQTSGALYVLFPNALQRHNYIGANRIISIPEAQAPFSINASGPTGVEGVKAIATTEPIDIAQFAGRESFVAVRTPQMQNKLCENIRSITENLDANEWDIAEWTFEITKR